MEATKTTVILPDVTTANPEIIFGLGLLVGSLIGVSGVIIASIAGVGYYYREVLNATIRDTPRRLTYRTSTDPDAKSWYTNMYNFIFPSVKKTE